MSSPELDEELTLARLTQQYRHSRSQAQLCESLPASLRAGLPRPMYRLLPDPMGASHMSLDPPDHALDSAGNEVWEDAEEDDDEVSFSGTPSEHEVLQRLQGFFAGRGGEGLSQQFLDMADLAMGRSNANEMVQMLYQVDDHSDPFLLAEQLAVLNQQLLVMNSVVAERTIPAAWMCRLLVGVLSDESLQEHQELQLLATRCVHNLIELNPDYIHRLVLAGGIEALASKLMDLSYIDLAEQVLLTLDIIARVRGRQVARRALLVNVVQFLDFFTLHAQRKALALVANAAQHLPRQWWAQAPELMAVLSRVCLEYSDVPLVELAFLLVARLVHRMHTLPETLAAVWESHTLVLRRMCLSLAAACAGASSPDLGPLVSRAVGLTTLGALTTLASSCPELSLVILTSCDPGDCVARALGAGNHQNDKTMAAPRAVLLGVLAFVCAFLPPPPPPALLSGLFFHSPTRAGEKIAEQRRVVFAAPEASLVLLAFVDQVYPLQVLVYAALADPLVRRNAIVALTRTLALLSPASISASPSTQPLVSLLAQSLAKARSAIVRKDLVPPYPLVAATVYVGHVLATRSPLIVGVLRREGLISEARQLAAVLPDTSAEDTLVSSRRSLLSELASDHLDLSRPPSDQPLDADLVEGQDVVPHAAGVIRRLCLLVAGSDADEGRDGNEQLQQIELLLTQEPIPWLQVWAAVAAALSGPSAVSLFELMNSGVVPALEQHGLWPMPEFDAVPVDTVRSLVLRLQDILNRTELFDVVLSGPSQLLAALLTRQVHIQLTTENAPAPVMVQIQAIATFRLLEQFILRRSILEAAAASLTSAEQSPPLPLLLDQHVEFVFDGEAVPVETTVYGAVARTPAPFQTAHQVHYKLVPGPPVEVPLGPVALEDSVAVKASDVTHTVVRLLAGVHALVQHRPEADCLDLQFVNWKLTSKLKRQLDDPLVVASGLVPLWVYYMATTAPFVFPLETRVLFLQLTLFGYSRMIQVWQQQLRLEAAEHQQAQAEGLALLGLAAAAAAAAAAAGESLGQVLRLKVRVLRQRMFESALKVLDMYGNLPSVLEVEYFDEAGTGLGPTLEFYAEVSRGFATQPCMWREQDAALFPAPCSRDSSERPDVLRLFRYLGQFLAKAILDQRLVDVQLHPAVLDLARGEAPSLEILARVDPVLARSLEAITPATASALGLAYEVPGYPHYPLGGGEVSLNNAEQYVRDVVDACVGSGIRPQLDAFVEGFSGVVPFLLVAIFTSVELVRMFGGDSSDEYWAPEAIAAALHTNHGYTPEHPLVVLLVAVVLELTPPQRRQFVQFLTGLLVLPHGGFARLRPPLTVVMKTLENGAPDDQLPLVMTCANYLKLPNYLSQQVLRARLLTAIAWGRSAFLLS